MRRYFFTKAGGGVRGKVAGIVPGTMTEVGRIIAVSRLFTGIFLHAGGMITGIICGGDRGGNINEYPIEICNGTGIPGKKTDIGKSKTPGEYRG